MLNPPERKISHGVIVVIVGLNNSVPDTLVGA